MATIEVILTEDIHRLGNAGDVVRVKAGQTPRTPARLPAAGAPSPEPRTEP